MPRNRVGERVRVRTAARRRGEDGVSTLEVVLAAPVMTLFILTLFFLGYYAESVSKVQAAAADAARMASVQYQTANVRTTARLAAWSDLAGTCNRDSGASLPVSSATMNIALPGNPPAGTTSAQSTTRTIKVTVTCDVRVLGVSYSITESSYAPLDFFGGQQ